jgi:hypothetical protein
MLHLPDPVPARYNSSVSSVNFNGDDVFPLVLLVGPTVALALWHKIEWGSGFGPISGFWRASSVTAAILLAGFVALTIYFGADEVRAFVGSRRSRGELPFFLFPGMALATVLFPGPASEVAGKYMELAREKATHTFSAVGWLLFAAWLLFALFGLFARAYGS